jgi:UDP:flavonoid glycosyltransferase YjiC (YdhE family)
VKLFVTHGGLSSLGEAVYADVPMIMIPFTADQPRNAYMMEDAGTDASRQAYLTE